MKKTIAVLLSLALCFCLLVPISGMFISGEAPDTQPVFESFGNKVSLGGSWTAEDVDGVGTVYRATAPDVAELNSAIQDFKLDFKVNVPKNTVSPFSVLARQVGTSSYELTVNKNAGAGITCGFTGGEYVSDDSLNIADEKWHSVSIRMLEKRAVILLDGIKIFDDVLEQEAVSGALKLNVNAIDTCFANIVLDEVTVEDMDTVADYDFSTDTYQNVLSGWNTEFDVYNNVSGRKFTTSSWTPKATIKSASTNADVLSLAKVTDFALTFNMMWKLSANEWQRGIQIKMPNGKTVNISGSRCCFSDTSNVVSHDSVGNDFHRYDVVLSGTTLKVFIDRKEVYSQSVPAATTADSVVIAAHNQSEKGDVYRISNLTLKTGTGVHEPEPAPELEMPETMYTKMNNNGWVRDGLSVHSTNLSNNPPTDNKYTGWGCALASAQNFIFDFNLKIGAEEKGSVELRLRHKYASGNYGYQLTFAASKLTVAKYNDGTNNITVLQTIAADFSSGTDIRIAANEEMLWIAFDGIRVFKIEDAYKGEGVIQISHTTNLTEGGAVISGISALRYKEKTANAGISDPVKSDIILSGEDIAAGMKGQGWTTIEGGTTATIETAHNKDYDGWGYKIAKVQNFIFDFTLDFADDENGAVELRLRHGTTSVCNLGYRLYFTRDTLTVGKYHDNDFQNDQIAKVVTDFTKGAKVRIAANDGMLWISIDGVRVFKITDAYTADGYIQISHTVNVPSGRINLTNMLLREYSDEKANDGVTDKTESDSGIISTGNEILTAMVNTAWTRKNKDMVVNTVSTGKGTQVGNVNDFIFDFTVRISPAETGDLQVRVRHDYNSKSNLGYVFLLSATRISLNKYNTDNFQSTTIDSRSIDFSASKRVRVVANGGTVWLSVNGEKIFEIKNAYNDSKKIIVQNAFANKGTVFFSEPCLYKYSDELANQKVSAPPADTEDFPVSEMVSVDKILKLFKAVGHDITDTKVINNEAGGGKGVNLCGTRDFILNFKLKIKQGSAGAVTVKFRHYYQNANFGYVVNFDRKSVAFTRYLEKKDGSAVTYGSEKFNFTNGIDVRIVAKDGLVWLSFDGVKKFELTDAALYSGQIQFLLFGENGDVELSDFKLTSYGVEESYEGMTNRNLQVTVPKLLQDYEIGNQKDAQKVLGDRFDYENLDGVDTIKFSAAGLNRESGFYNRGLTDFVLSFRVNMDDCTSVNNLQFNFRKSWDDVRNYGFVMILSQGQVQLLDYSTKSYSLGKLLGKSVVKMNGWVPVKIVAHGDTVAIIIDDKPVIKQKVETLKAGTITVQNNLSGTQNIHFADIVLTEYYEGAMPDGEIVSVSSPTNIAKKTYKEAVKIVAGAQKKSSTTVSSFPVIPVVITGCVVLLAGIGALITVFVIKKRKIKA